jgi:hypothetical protein
MSSAQQEFKASAVFVQNLSMGLEGAYAALSNLKHRVLKSAPAEKACTLTPKTRSTVSQMPPTGILKSAEQTPKSRTGPLTPAARVTFHMPMMDAAECGYGNKSDADDDFEAVPRRSLSTASLASVASQGPCHMVLFVDPTPTHSDCDFSLTPRTSDTQMSLGV